MIDRIKNSVKKNTQIIDDLTYRQEFLKSELEDLVIISFHPEKFELNKIKNAV